MASKTDTRLRRMRLAEGETEPRAPMSRPTIRFICRSCAR